jgi:hypothetical protein
MTKNADVKIYAEPTRRIQQYFDDNENQRFSSIQTQGV